MSREMIDLAVAAAPVALLIWLMVKRRGVPAGIALPVSALLLYVLHLIHFRTDLRLLHASIIEGALTALTPLSIVCGAILLFKVMEYSGATDAITGRLRRVTGNRVAQLMIVGWSFSFLIEGISGFGTPAALAAPLLIGLGFTPIPTVVFCLVMNTVPVSFGAVGTPVWFGFGPMGLTDAELTSIGFRSALIHAAASLVIPVLALRFLVPWNEIRRNAGFVYLSIVASVLPYLILSRFDHEFPAIAGGFAGLAVSVILARRGVGLEPSAAVPGTPNTGQPGIVKTLWPIGSAAVILLVTRLPRLGLRGWLTDATPYWELTIGRFGDLAVSRSLVLQLKNILGTAAQWQHPALYVPSIIPFVPAAIGCALIFGMPRTRAAAAVRETGRRVGSAAPALIGAMIFVKLLMLGGDRSCAEIIGRAFASAAGGGWQFAAPWLGALGAFVSGSNTVSNLTFGGIQDSIAAALGLERATVLALQLTGGAMGNVVCVHNVVAVLAVLGIRGSEGEVLKRTFRPLLVYGVIASGMSLFVGGIDNALTRALRQCFERIS